MQILKFLPHLWLVIIGLSLTNQPWLSSYLVLTLFLLNLSDSYDNGRTDDTKYYALVSLLTFILIPFQWVSFAVIILGFILLYLYSIAKKYPISAFYKGYAYSLLFFLPVPYITVNSIYVYLVLGFLASLSEIVHEAEHYYIDELDGRTTTAHILRLRFSKLQRRICKGFAILGGVILAVITSGGL